MKRRSVLAGALLPLGGCLSGESGDATPSATTSGSTATPAEGGVYVQSFQETMSMQGQATRGDYRFALLFAVPHTFWTVTGTEVNRTPKREEDAVHLMAVVWDPETGTVLPEVGLSAEITRDGDLVSQEVIYPMLSQPMGFHYGGNFPLPGDGEYTTRLSVSGLAIRRTGSFKGRFGDGATAEIGLSFTEESREQVRTRKIEQAGQPGALAPMDMGGIPINIAPTREQLPGAVLGEGRIGDVVMLVTALDPPAGVNGERYLAVSARTPYNGLLLPAMALSATITRDGETLFEGPFRRTLDPALDYHYGAAVPPLQSDDEITLRIGTPSQTARHEGYETAFLRTDAVTVEVS